MSDDELPVILVSAGDAAAADAIISELTGDEAEESGGERVWRLANKYYTARVRLRVLLDSQAAPPAAHAHLLSLAAHECTAAVLQRRAAAARLQRGAVRLALCACAEPAPELQAAARAHGYELVPAGAAGGAAAGPFPELSGLARAREALHAHVWPGLRAPAPGPAEAADCVRRAELLASALGALQSARPPPDAPREERLLRAEQLLHAFCQALGTDMDDL